MNNTLNFIVFGTNIRMNLSEIYIPKTPTTPYYWVTNDSHFIWGANFLNAMENLEKKWQQTNHLV